jgi:hypothetical protein
MTAAADGELIVLCEGDMTFRAADLEKFLAYIVLRQLFRRETARTEAIMPT